MTTITAQPQTPAAIKSLLNANSLVNTQGTQESAPIGSRKEINLQSLPPMSTELSAEKPLLSASNLDIAPEKLSEVLSQLDPQELGQASQAINMPAVSRLVQEMHSLVINDSVEQKSAPTVDSAKGQQFVGIASSNIISELTSLLRKVAVEINISDRQVNDAFLKLNGKMVQAAAASTIKEGKEMLTGAITNFGVSLGISGAGAAFQGKSLRTQNNSIKNNLTPGTQNVNAGDHMSQLNGQASTLTGKTNAAVLKGKDGLSIELTDQGTAAQKLSVGKNGQDAANSTKAFGHNQLAEHNRIMNSEGVKRGVAEQGSRLADNAGNMAAAPSQANAKEESANAMIEQDTASAARKVSENAEKTMSESTELLKKMNESLINIVDSHARTFQSSVRG